jgi:uncharacterized membrane protein YciS (DUF1049 family)
MEIAKETIFQQCCEYHRHLVGRRWQYFTAFLLLNGLMLNAWAQSTSLSKLFRATFCIGNIFVGMVFLRLIARVRRRIRLNAQRTNDIAGMDFFEVGRVGNVAWDGVTIWLYIAVTLVSAMWSIALLEISYYASISTAIIFLCNLISIGIKHSGEYISKFDVTSKSAGKT